jgi:hypothetical protein
MPDVVQRVHLRPARRVRRVRAMPAAPSAAAAAPQRLRAQPVHRRRRLVRQPDAQGEPRGDGGKRIRARGRGTPPDEGGAVGVLDRPRVQDPRGRPLRHPRGHRAGRVPSAPPPKALCLHPLYALAMPRQHEPARAPPPLRHLPRRHLCSLPPPPLRDEAATSLPRIPSHPRGRPSLPRIPSHPRGRPSISECLSPSSLPADDLPNRDCNAKASNGENNADVNDASGAAAALEQYKRGYIDPFAAVLAEYSQVGILSRALPPPPCPRHPPSSPSTPR